MHVGLTEILRCPRCPGDLVLLAEHAAGGRVASGRLGCAACGARYPIDEGIADFRGDETEPSANADDAGEPAVEALVLAALLGLADARGVVLLAGAHVALADPLAGLTQGVEIVTLESPPDDETRGGAGPDAAAPPGIGRSRLRITSAIPVRDRRATAIAVEADGAVPLEEAVRVLAPGKRIVVSGAGDAVADALAGLSCQVLAAEHGMVAAEREGPADPPKLYQLA